jgi:hypothetical protein
LHRWSLVKHPAARQATCGEPAALARVLAVVTALDEALRSASEQRQLDPTGARLIHHYSNAVYLLPAESAIARGASERGTRLATNSPVSQTPMGLHVVGKFRAGP